MAHLAWHAHKLGHKEVWMGGWVGGWEVGVGVGDRRGLAILSVAGL